MTPDKSITAPRRGGALVSVGVGVGSGLGAAAGSITGDWHWMPIALSACTALGAIAASLTQR